MPGVRRSINRSSSAHDDNAAARAAAIRPRPGERCRAVVRGVGVGAAARADRRDRGGDVAVGAQPAGPGGALHDDRVRSARVGAVGQACGSVQRWADGGGPGGAAGRVGGGACAPAGRVVRRVRGAGVRAALAGAGGEAGAGGDERGRGVARADDGGDAGALPGCVGRAAGAGPQETGLGLQRVVPPD